MSKIDIKLITGLHIGSGQTLALNNDYCKGRGTDANGSYYAFGIIDPRKVFNIIGADKDAIAWWVAAIGRNESIFNLIKCRKPDANLSDFCSRIIKRQESADDKHEIKECIHDGFGRPYIPGSSIKGAIRTAVLASEAKSKHFYSYKQMEEFETRAFGEIQNSAFRFLHVGDAIFERAQTISLLMANINERNEHTDFFDKTKSQVVECLPFDSQTTFELRLKSDLQKKCGESVHTMPQSMNSLNTLFSVINSHTKHLLESEIEYWKNNIRLPRDTSDEEIVKRYIERCEEIIGECNGCKTGKECIIRIGHASGWRFITGAWTKDSPQMFREVMKASRPPKRRRGKVVYDYNDDYPNAFPKSRRISWNDDDKRIGLLGFVKLTICGE